jgi:hypothetical protein
MKRLIFTFLLLMPFTAECANQYAQLNTAFDEKVFESDQCSMYSWVTLNGKRQKIVFRGELSKQDDSSMCTITIAAETFEKYFETCFLSGLTSTKNFSDKRSVWGIEFSGLVERTYERLYFFEWFDAEYTNASYLCLVKNT